MFLQPRLYRGLSNMPVVNRLQQLQGDNTNKPNNNNLDNWEPAESFVMSGKLSYMLPRSSGITRLSKSWTIGKPP